MSLPEIILYSDLHLERQGRNQELRSLPTPPKGAVVVLAGDVGNGVEGVLFGQENFPDNQVIFVMGNHEFYGSSVEAVTAECRKRARGSNVMVLENKRVDIDGVAFLGCALWTDFDLYGEPYRSRAFRVVQNEMNDSKWIKYRDQRFTPPVVREVHLASRAWLKESLKAASSEGRQAVVITHHAPSVRLLQPRHRPRSSNLLSAAFASSLEHWMTESWAPSVWCSGHTHYCAVERIGRTLLVANAAGYFDEGEGREFRRDGRVIPFDWVQPESTCESYADFWIRQGAEATPSE